MSVSKKSKKSTAPNSQQITGCVVSTPLGGISKSAHNGLLIRTPENEEFWLQRLGGNPYHDEQLESLVGKTIKADGLVNNHIFLVKNFELVQTKPSKKQSTRKS